MALDIRTSELEHTFIKERIASVEKHFADISSKINSYVKKLAYLRDSGDEVAESISAFASKETYNRTLRLSLGEFSDVLASIQEYREAQVHRTQVKVINELDNYSPVCKHAKVQIKKCFDSQVKSLRKKAELEKTRSKNPPNWQKITKAEKEVSQAQDEATRLTQDLSRQVEQFERKKIDDLKRLFLEFVKIEMLFHAKSIELYTKAFNVLSEINAEEDLNEFRSHFKSHGSSMDATAASSESHATIPKTIATNDEDATSSYESQVPKVQDRPRTIFTLKTSTTK